MAACLCMKTTKTKPAKPPSKDPEEKQALKGSNHLLKDDNDYNRRPEKPRANEHGSSTDLLLSKIYDLMETRVRSAAEEREKADVDDEVKNDWMLAAAVIDRFLFFTFGSLFVGGTCVFFAIFNFTP